MKNTKTLNYGTLIGKTTDNTANELSMFSDGTTLTAVYHIGTDNEYVCSANIEKVQKHIDDYIFTPFAEFANWKIK